MRDAEYKAWLQEQLAKDEGFQEERDEDRKAGIRGHWLFYAAGEFFLLLPVSILMKALARMFLS